MPIGKPELLAEINQKLILKSLRKTGPQSRVELSRELGLSFPSVSSNIEALLAQDYIITLQSGGRNEGGLGRKPIRYAYNANWGYVVSVDLGRSRIRMMICDMCGKELLSDGFGIRDVRDEDMLSRIDDLFASLVSSSGVTMDKVCCVCVAAPGILNPVTQRLEAAPFLSPTIRNTRIDSHLAQKYHVQTCTGNTVNYAAIAEKWQGAGMPYNDIVYIDLSVGLGSALILNGELVEGFNGAAGEIAYMLPGVGFHRDVYKEEGVLESVLSSAEVEHRMAGDSDRNGVSARELFESEQSGQWRPYLEEIRDYLALTLVNVTAMINPEVIIIGGGFGQALLTHFRGYFIDYLTAHVPFVPKLEKAALDDKAVLLGATAYALRTLHEGQTASKQ